MKQNINILVKNVTVMILNNWKIQRLLLKQKNNIKIIIEIMKQIIKIKIKYTGFL